MQLLSLPEEMLASVLKYSKFGTVTRLRKVNSQVDRASVRFGINKPKVESFHANAEDNDMSIQYAKNIFLEDEAPMILKLTTNTIIRSNDLTAKIEEMLEKVRHVELFSISDLVLDEEWRNRLLNFKCSKIRQIELANCILRISLEDLVNILGKFEASNMYMSSETRILGAKLATDQVLCSLIPVTQIQWNFPNRRMCPEITDATLIMLQATLPEKYKLHNYLTQFTAKEVIRTFQIAKESKKIIGYWDLGFLQCDSEQEVENIVADLPKIDICDVAKFTNFTKVWLRSHKIVFTFNLCCDRLL